MNVNDRVNAALLLMDFQNGVVERLGTPQALAAAADALAAARAAGVPVIHVRVGFRPGYPEVSPANQSFSAIATSGADLSEGGPATQVHVDLAPADGETVVVKRRVSAFTGSDLEVVLRAQGIRTLVLGGIATSGVVLSTLREAADRDYRLVVLADACADADPEVHRVLTEKVFPRQAEVTTVARWSAAL